MSHFAGCTVYLIRHGLSEANVNPLLHRSMADSAIKLTSQGEGQAYMAGIYLRNRLEDDGRPVRIFYSAYDRTAQTAAQIRRALRSGDFAFPDSEFRENGLIHEQSFGLFDGLSREQQRELYPEYADKINHYWESGDSFFAPFPIFGGESPAQIQLRARSFIDTLYRDAEKHGPMNFVVVTHGVTLRVLAKSLLNADHHWYHEQKNPGNCHIRELANEGAGFVDHGYVYQGMSRIAASGKSSGIDLA